jgi:hypothetical protein
MFNFYFVSSINLILDFSLIKKIKKNINEGYEMGIARKELTPPYNFLCNPSCCVGSFFSARVYSKERIVQV